MRLRIAGFVSSKQYCAWIGVLIVMVGFLGLVGSVKAQWTPLQSFAGKTPTAIYFLDHQGANGFGLVGFNDRTVYRTTDNGNLWLATVPPPWKSGTYTAAFVFQDVLTGWAAFGFSPGPPPGITGGIVWNTTDGGQNWMAQNPTNGFNSITINDSSQRLICTGMNGPGSNSTDGGANWAPNQLIPGKNGVAWSDPSVGVMTCDSGSFARTVDGGITWLPVPSMKAPCWVPYAIPGTHTFFCVSHTDKHVYRSDDGGATWNSTYVFTPTPTGDIEGVNDTLFVQTTAAGFFESTDMGVTWMPMCGPSNPVRTRFYVRNGDIFAGEPGKLWFLPRAASAGVAPTPTTLSQKVMTFNSYKCGTFDSVLQLGYQGGCTLTINSVKLTGSPNFRLGAQTVGTGSFFGIDEIHVLYAPSLARRDTGQVEINYTVSGKTFDTLVTLYAIPTTHIDAAWNIPQLGYTFPNGCHPIDTVVGLKNRSCDTLVITAAEVIDPTGFQLGSITFPIIVLPGDSTRIPVHVGTHYIGDYYTGLRLHFRSQLVTADTTFPLYLTISKTPWPAFKPLAITIKDRCKAFDTAIVIKNTFCDAISLDTVRLSDSSAFKLLGQVLSLSIPAGDSVKLILHLDPTKKGLVTGTVTAMLHAGKDTLDTTIKVSLNTQNDIQPAITFNTAKLNFGSTSECVPKLDWLRLVNTVCRPMVITSIQFTSADGSFSMDNVPLPDTLFEGGKDSIGIHCHAKGSGPVSATMVIHIVVDGIGHDTLIQVVGTAFQTVTAELAEPLLDLDTVASCSPKTGTTTLTNLSCDSVIVTSATLASQNGFALTGLTLPHGLGVGDSIVLTVTLDPSASGSIDNSIDIRIHPKDPNGTEVSRVLQLHAYVVKGAAQLAIANDVMHADSLAPCTTFDTTITVTNLSNCDSALLSRLSMTGSNAVTLSGVPSLPTPAGPGKTITFHLQLTPVRDSLFVNKIHLVGTGLDTVITVYVTANHSNTTVLNTLQYDPHFAVKLCTTATRWFGFQAAGCDPMIVDSAYLTGVSGQTQFDLDTTMTFPVSLAPGQKVSLPIRFNPAGTGDSNVTLHVFTNGKTLDHAVSLSGAAVGIPVSAHLGMTAGDGTLAATSGPEGIVTASLQAVEGFGDTLGLTTISTHLRLNPNVLSYINISAPGWTVITNVEDAPGQRKITLQRTTATSVVAGTSLATLTFKAEVADSTETGVRVVDAQFNEADPLFESCVARPLMATDQLVVHLTNECGNSTIRTMLQGNLVNFLSFHPNPAGGGSGNIIVELEAKGTAEIHIGISDATGLIAQSSTSLQIGSGRSSIPLAVDALPNGAYFLTVEVNGSRIVKPLIIRR